MRFGYLHLKIHIFDVVLLVQSTFTRDSFVYIMHILSAVVSIGRKKLDICIMLMQYKCPESYIFLLTYSRVYRFAYDWVE